MSQSHIRRQAIESQDWMRELEMDAQRMQALVTSLDVTATKALHNLGNKDLVAAGTRLLEIREGLRLLCEVTGIRIQS